MSGDFLTPDVVEAVRRHLDDDHAEDNIAICRGVGGRPDATSARMRDLDRDAITFDAETPEGPVVVRVPFSRPLESRPDIRAEVARMYHDSVALLGASADGPQG